jgi:hypothetical protein
MDILKLKSSLICGKRYNKKDQQIKTDSFSTGQQASSPIAKSLNPIDFSLSFYFFSCVKHRYDYFPFANTLTFLYTFSYQN